MAAQEFLEPGLHHLAIGPGQLVIGYDDDARLEQGLSRFEFRYRRALPDDLAEPGQGQVGIGTGGNRLGARRNLRGHGFQ